MQLEDYRDQYLADNERYARYLRVESQADESIVAQAMIQFAEGEYAIGCAWPGNFSKATVTDYSKVWTHAPAPLLPHSTSTHWYYDYSNPQKILYPLRTVEGNEQAEYEWNRTSLYNFPYRLRSQINTNVFVNDEPCSRSDLSEDEIQLLLSQMTLEEIAEREVKLNKLFYSKLQPSVEYPVKLRIDGIDDGAAEKLYASVDEALADLAVLEGALLLTESIWDMGFYGTG